MDTRLTAACSLLLLLAQTAAGEDGGSAACRREQCPHYRSIRYYEEAGCVRADGSTACCPTRYNCSALATLDKKKCHHGGRAYDMGAQVTDMPELVCIPTCTCVLDSARATEEARLHCAHVDCPEYFDSQGVAPGCYRQYATDQCCSTGVQCVNATEGRNDAVECVFNGKTYHEGQYIDVPGGKCMSCVCQEGFDGTLDGPWCRNYSCDIMLTKKPYELAECAPVFWKDRHCCPMGFHCPVFDDELTEKPTPPGPNDPQCAFGNVTMKVGDGFRTATGGCIKCKCEVPPLVTCTQFPMMDCESEDEKNH